MILTSCVVPISLISYIILCPVSPLNVDKISFCTLHFAPQLIQSEGILCMNFITANNFELCLIHERLLIGQADIPEDVTSPARKKSCSYVIKEYSWFMKT